MQAALWIFIPLGVGKGSWHKSHLLVDMMIFGIMAKGCMRELLVDLIGTPWANITWCDLIHS